MVEYTVHTTTGDGHTDQATVQATHAHQAAFIAGALLGAAVVIKKPELLLVADLAGTGAVQNYVEEALSDLDVSAVRA